MPLDNSMKQFIQVCSNYYHNFVSTKSYIITYSEKCFNKKYCSRNQLKFVGSATITFDISDTNIDKSYSDFWQ